MVGVAVVLINISPLNSRFFSIEMRLLKFATVLHELAFARHRKLVESAQPQDMSVFIVLVTFSKISAALMNQEADKSLQ